MMKNISTKEFCRKFRACKEGIRFALRYNTMRECYSALLAGEAGEDSAGWAIWVATREGVMSYRNLRMFAIKCARRVQHLMTDSRSIKALDVAERYANGETTAAELAAAWADAVAARDTVCATTDDTESTWAASSAVAAARCSTDPASDTANAAASAAAWYAARDVVYVACDAASDVEWITWDAASDAESKAQLGILAEFGNPFEEE